MTFWRTDEARNATAASLTALPSDDVYFPAATDRTVISELASQLSEWTSEQFDQGPTEHEAAVLLSPKRGQHFFRPVWLLHPMHAVRLNAIARTIAPATDDPPKWHEVADATAQASNDYYIVRFDIANYYEYIDHDLLANSILNISGTFSIASELRATLGSISGRHYGLPQVQRPAILLGELYAGYIEHPLRRDYGEVFRYSDDFNVAASDENSVGEILAAAHRLSRSVGLAVNEQKVAVYAPTAYAAAAEAEIERTRLLVEEAETESLDADFGTDSDYGDEQTPLAETVDRIQAGVAILEFLASSDRATRATARNATRAFFLGKNLARGSYSADTALLLIERFPWLTQSILADVADYPDLRDSIASQAAPRINQGGSAYHFKTEWFLTWLCWAIRDAPIDRSLADFLGKLASSLDYPVARAYAMDALSIANRGTPRDWEREIDHIHPAVRTTALAAIARRGGKTLALPSARSYLDHTLVGHLG